MPNTALNEHLSLTAAEGELLALVGEGLEDAEIAAATGLELNEVQRRMSAFLTRVDAEDRFAVVWAGRHRVCCVEAPGDAKEVID